MKAQGLERPQIVFNSSHTRNAPLVKGLQPGPEPTDAAELKKIDQYSEALARYLGEVAAAALADLKPARIDFGAGRVAFAKGPQEAVPVLRVLTPKGGVIAVLFGYVVDNATLDEGSYAISGDYAGVAEAALEKEYPGAIALFYMLCGAGRNPEPIGTIELMKQHGAALADEVSRVMKSALTPVRGRLKSALIETAVPFVADAKEMRQLPFQVQVVRFDEGFKLVALGGEGAPGYPGKIRKLLHDKEIVVAGCADSGTAVAPGGGETEERVLDAVKRAWKRAGKR
jgi:hypothetical protein